MSTAPFEYAMLRIEDRQPWTMTVHYPGQRIETFGVYASQLATFGARMNNVVKPMPCATEAPGSIGVPLSPIERQDGTRVYFMEKAPAVVDVRFHRRRGRGDHREQRFRFPHPRMLIAVEGRVDGHGVFTHANSYFFALRAPARDPNQPVFYYPGWNIFDDDRICWGDFRIPVLPVGDLHNIPQYHFELLGNDDLDSYSRQRNGYTDTTEMLTDLTHRNVLRFPEERLHQHPRYPTLRRVIERFGGQMSV